MEARHALLLASWMLFLLAQGAGLVPWQAVRHPGMGNQAAAQILETITANYQACQFPIVCLHSTRNQGAGDEDVRGNFQFWLAKGPMLLGGWPPPLPWNPQGPHYLSVLAFEPTSSFQNRSQILQSAGKVGWRDPGSQIKAHISAVGLVSVSG